MSSQEKLASIESDVISIQKRLSRSNRISIVVGGLVLALMLGYFVYGYKEINSVLKPTIIVDLAQTIVDDNIPVIKKTVQTEVEKNAPVWAQSLSNQALASVPQLRESLVNYTVDQTDALITQSVRMSDERFDEVISSNRANIQNAINELEHNDDISVELLGVIQNGFNDILKADLERDSQEILAYSKMMEDKMTRLVSGKGLNEAERLERQALMVLRRLQLSELKE